MNKPKLLISITATLTVLAAITGILYYLGIQRIQRLRAQRLPASLLKEPPHA